jgi:hypothetical protein
MSDPDTDALEVQGEDAPAVQQKPQSAVAKDLDDIARVAKMMAQSGFFEDAKTAAQAGVKILAGRELGIPEMAAMRGVHVMEGNTTLSGPLLAALIKRHPKYDYRTVEATKKRAEIAFYEDGEQVGTASFSMEDARRITAYYDKNGSRKSLADKTNWENYPSDMLFWRALTRGQRRYAPEVGMGSVYTPDELGAVTDRNGNVVDVEPEEVSSPGSEDSAGNSTGDASDTSAAEEETWADDAWYQRMTEEIVQRIEDGALTPEEVDTSAVPKSHPIDDWPEEHRDRIDEVLAQDSSGTDPEAATESMMEGDSALPEVDEEDVEQDRKRSEDGSAKPDTSGTTAFDEKKAHARSQLAECAKVSFAKVEEQANIYLSQVDDQPQEWQIEIRQLAEQFGVEPLPHDLPFVEKVRSHGIYTLPRLERQAEDGQLAAIDGIGEARVQQIRDVLDGLDFRSLPDPEFEDGTEDDALPFD